MRPTRRLSLKLALAAAAASTLPAFAQTPDEETTETPAGEAAPTTFETEGGTVTVIPVEHASLYLVAPGHVMLIDPVGDPALYADMPAPDLILITHEHGDHFDAETLAAVAPQDARLITNPAVHALLPPELQARATAMANGDELDLDTLRIEAVPAYNITPERLEYHPEGRDNGYVLTIADKRVYIAGDTEATDEMKALEDIEVAFIPMNLPYTMTPEQAAEGVAAFAPARVYPYHHRDTDLTVFTEALAASGAQTQVVILDWYPQTGEAAAD